MGPKLWDWEAVVDCRAERVHAPCQPLSLLPKTLNIHLDPCVFSSFGVRSDLIRG